MPQDNSTRRPHAALWELYWNQTVGETRNTVCPVTFLIATVGERMEWKHPRDWTDCLCLTNRVFESWVIAVEVDPKLFMRLRPGVMLTIHPYHVSSHECRSTPYILPTPCSKSSCYCDYLCEFPESIVCHVTLMTREVTIIRHFTRTLPRYPTLIKTSTQAAGLSIHCLPVPMLL